MIFFTTVFKSYYFMVVPIVMADVLNHGGSKLGDITSSEVEGVGLLTFVYLTDPEGNIIELQAWK